LPQDRGRLLWCEQRFVIWNIHLGVPYLLQVEADA
jgi:hypothetical protein